VFEYVVPSDTAAGYCLAAGRYLLAVADGLQASIPAIWPLLTDADTRLEDLFAILAGRGVSTAPAFAIAEIVDDGAGTVRALVHGDAVAEALGVVGAPVTGAGLATWRESTWLGVEGVMIGLGAARTGVETLPIAGGAVRADWIRWRPGRADAAADTGAQATTPPPSPRAPTAATPGEPAAHETTTARDHRPATEPAIRVDDGPLLGLELPLVVGRRPTPGLSEAGAPTVPVVVPSPQRLVSATHLLIERDGRAARLRDLGSKNGSLLRLPDGTRELLRDSASRTVPVGTIVEVGDGVLLEIVARAVGVA